MQEISKNLIIRASKGDIEAFESVYKTTSRFVYNTVLRMSGNREDAEEITQDVFIRIYKKLKWFQFRSSFTTWVYRIAVNAAINTCKRRQKERSRTVEYDDNIELSEAPNRGKDESDKVAIKEIVASLLDRLNPEQRACVVLRSIEGLSYREIAKTLNININTVRSRLKRARAGLVSHYSEMRGKR